MQILKNFLSPTECAKLNDIALKYLEKGVLKEYNFRGRFSTKLIEPTFTFDPYVYEVSTNVRKAVGIDMFRLETGRGKDGINVAVTVNDGYIFLHKDPRGPNKEITYRCNILTQKSEVGGEVVMDDKVVPLEIGDILCYAVSEEPHLVTAVEGNTPRILWMFGAHIPIESWDFENIKVQQ